MVTRKGVGKNAAWEFFLHIRSSIPAIFYDVVQFHKKSSEKCFLAKTVNQNFFESDFR